MTLSVADVSKPGKVFILPVDKVLKPRERLFSSDPSLWLVRRERFLPVLSNSTVSLLVLPVDGVCEAGMVRVQLGSVGEDLVGKPGQGALVAVPYKQQVHMYI